MTEKNYGGSMPYGAKSMPVGKSSAAAPVKVEKKAKKEESKNANHAEGYDQLIKAGQIAKQAREYAVSIAKKGMPLIELAEKIEAKIVELGAKPAFPVNLSINEIAAHDTPAHNDTRTAHGLLKIDIGAHVDGFVADTAISVDLEGIELNKELIATAQACLAAAMENVNADISLGDLGKLIEKPAMDKGLLTIRNLTGHSIEQYDLHAGLNIPNYDTKQDIGVGEGVYAIEPFVTNGEGMVRDSRQSGIYVVQKEGNVRDSFARQVLQYIADEYAALPFCSRWIVKKFGTRALIALKQIESAGILHHYSTLVESGKGIVAQAEHTFIIEKGSVTATTA